MFSCIDDLVFDPFTGFCATFLCYTACSIENKLDQSCRDEKLKKFCEEILEVYEKNDVNGPIGNNSSYFRSDGIGTHDNLKYVDDLSKKSRLYH
ncbi:MAG: hypothetical protein Pg6B_08790 [Candidatus Azobacteroides pseudotrichonymphae]|nr:MAG: hypothetical protein Pg6B_08790 [Candidatus Azobacteroides pseudotrichonymphae]